MSCSGEGILQLIKARQQHSANDNSPAMQEVVRALADARAQLVSGPVASSARLVVTVQADKSVLGKFAADDVVYVFARALQGPPMPLAVVCHWLRQTHWRWPPGWATATRCNGQWRWQPPTR